MIYMATFLEIVVNSIFTGIGVTIGTYLGNRAILKRVEKIMKKINNKGKIYGRI